MHTDSESWKDSVHQSGNLTDSTSDKDKYLPQAFILWPHHKGFEANVKIGFGYHSLLKSNLALKSLVLGQAMKVPLLVTAVGSR